MNRIGLKGALALLLILAHGQVWGDVLRVAVAANFRGTLEEIGREFTDQASSKLSLSSAATGVLVQQIINGAPFDVLFSADAKHIDVLQQRGLVIESTRFSYAQGRLMLWGPHLGKTPVLADLADLRHRIGLANPAVAPYGMASRAVLQRLGLWDPAHSRLVRGNSVASVMQLASTGLVDLAFVGRSQLRRFRDATSSADAFEIPVAWYPPLDQQAVVLRSTQYRDVAQALLAWTASDSGRAIIQRDGYALPVRGGVN